MGICRKTLILPLASALAAIAVALPVGLAVADDQPDTLVVGVVIPAVAGQNIGVTVGGVACAKAVIPSGAPNGVTDGTGAYQLLLHNCPAGRAMLTVNGAPSRTLFNLVPGNPFTENVPSSSFQISVPQLTRDTP